MIESGLKSILSCILFGIKIFCRHNPLTISALHEVAFLKEGLFQLMARSQSLRGRAAHPMIRMLHIEIQIIRPMVRVKILRLCRI
jgi:hypothetical protein